MKMSGITIILLILIFKTTQQVSTTVGDEECVKDGYCSVIDYAKDTELRETSEDASQRYAGRKIAHVMEALPTASPWNWDEVDTCPPHYYVDTSTHNLLTNTSIQHMVLGCAKIIEDKDDAGRYIIQTKHHGARATRWQLCRSTKGYEGNFKFSVLQGISFQLDDYNGVAIIPTKINYLCSSQTVQSQPWHLDGRVDTNEMVCPFGTAVCSLQAQYGSFGKTTILTNVRIGCCEIPPERWDDTIGKPNENITYDYIYNLQSRRPQFVFWDSDSVDLNLESVVTRYNVFHRKTEIEGNANATEIWSTKFCPTGEYINGFEVTNPKCVYYDGRRVHKIVFHCSDGNGTTSKLDAYGDNDQVHSGADITETRECRNCFYNSIQLDYHVDKRRPYLVHGWSLGMVSENDGRLDQISMGLTGRKDEGLESAKINCLSYWRLCGISTTVSSKEIGTLEGLFFKFICCPVPGSPGIPSNSVTPRYPIEENRT